MFFLPYSYGGTPISGNLHMTYITYISAHREYCTNLTRGITHPKDGCSWGAVGVIFIGTAMVIISLSWDNMIPMVIQHSYGIGKHR